MSKVYEAADQGVAQLLAETITKYHPGLDEHGVRIGVVMVTNPDGDAPPVTHAGHKCAAKIKKVSLKDRVTTPFDAIIYVDGDLWKDLHDKCRVALLDHETTHIEFAKIVAGRPETDDDGRPLLRLRPDDWCLTGFASVVERHGDFAMEKMAFEHLNSEHGQLLFDFAGVSEAPTLVEPVGV